MHALFFAGLLYALAALLVLEAGFFIQAWASWRRALDPLLLGLSTLLFAVYTAAGAGIYAGLGAAVPSLSRTCANLVAVAGMLAMALAVHFGLRYVKIRRERAIMTAVYGGAAACLALLSAGRFWSRMAVGGAELDVLGLHVPIPELSVTPPALACCLLGLLGLGAVTVLLARHWISGNRESQLVYIGYLFLTATVLNDTLALWTGWADTVLLAPLGCAAQAAAASHSLLQHYGRLSRDLRRQTDTLHRKSEELAESMLQIERTQDELARTAQLAAIGKLTGVIAERIGESLKTVQQAVAELHRPAADNPAARLGVLDAKLDEINEFVTKLLSFARPVVPQAAPFELLPLLDRVWAAAAPSTALRYCVEHTPPKPALMGDPDLLELAFANLISNAIQAMGEEGELSAVVTRRQVDDIAYTAIAFSDTGQGMTEQQCQQAPEPFFSSRPGQLGLGLPITAKIVEAHGGFLEIASQPGVGTTVTVLLPLTPAGAPPPESVPSEARAGQ